MSKLQPSEKSLGEIVGTKVTHVAGNISFEFGKNTPVFQITRILFEDGTSMNVEAEHDIAYIPDEGNMFRVIK